MIRIRANRHKIQLLVVCATLGIATSCLKKKPHDADILIEGDDVVFCCDAEDLPLTVAQYTVENNSGLDHVFVTAEVTGEIAAASVSPPEALLESGDSVSIKLALGACPTFPPERRSQVSIELPEEDRLEPGPWSFSVVHSCGTDTGSTTGATGTTGETTGETEDPSGEAGPQWVMLANEVTGGLGIFRLEDGMLTEHEDSPLLLGTSLGKVAATRERILASTVFGESVYVFDFDATTGQATLTSASPQSLSGNTHFLSIHPFLPIAYVTDLDGGQVHGVEVDALTGALTPVAGSPAMTGLLPHGVVVGPDGQNLYVAFAFNGGGLNHFGLDGAGGLLSGIELTGATNAFGLDISADGQCLAVATMTGINTYRVENSGEPTLVEQAFDAGNLYQFAQFGALASSDYVVGSNGTLWGQDPDRPCGLLEQRDAITLGTVSAMIRGIEITTGTLFMAVDPIGSLEVFRVPFDGSQLERLGASPHTIPEGSYGITAVRVE